MGQARRSGVAALVCALVLLVAGCTGDSSDEPSPTPQPTKASATEKHITFGAYGSEDELSAYQGVIDVFNSLSDHSDITLQGYRDHTEFLRAARGGSLPDVFLASRRDLAWLRETSLIQPVDEPLVERGLDFGDGYSRDALLAFSADSHLECMPYGISPMVLYYNTDLVDFDRMAKRGLQVPADPTAWSFEAFTAAVDFASRPGSGAKGVHIDPSIRGLAPFIYSGGGKVFDDETDPTSLAFSDGGTQAALERTLEVLRNPHVTLSQRQLHRASALEWFERGKLGMIEGFRDLTPELRQAHGLTGLNWDVISMPVLNGFRTVGDVTGLCISAKSADPSAAADFLVHMLSTPMVSRVVRAGYLVPANQEVALSDDFKQPGRLPHHAEVFNNGVRGIVDPPLLDNFPALEAAVAKAIHRMLTKPVITDLAAVTERIDEKSRAVLSPPEESPSESPSESSSESSSPGESASPSG